MKRKTTSILFMTNVLELLLFRGVFVMPKAILNELQQYIFANSSSAKQNDLDQLNKPLSCIGGFHETI